MQYALDKTKLPRGLSYPLKRSVLDAALSKAGVTSLHVVYYWTKTSGNVVLRADYCGELRKGWYAAGLSSITLYAVPSQERKSVESKLLEDGLSHLCSWLKRAEAAGNSWRSNDHHLIIEYIDGSLVVFED